MAWSAPVDPVGGTVITVAYAVSNILDPIRWLRLMTGNADPPGSAYVVVSTSTSGATWQKVPSDALATASVTNDKILDGAISASKIFPGNVTETALANGAVTADKLGPGAVTNPKILDGAITAAKIFAGNVGTTQLADLGVTSAKLGGGAVTNDKILDGAISSSKIFPGNVGTTQLADLGVTAGKLSAGAGANGQVLAMVAGALGWLSQASLAVGSATTAGSATFAANATQLDGHPPSLTPSAGAIPVADAAGKLDAWVTPAAFSIPSGLGAWCRTAAEIPAGFVRETSMDGVMAVGAGTTFGQTFTETQSYGTSWAHGHGLSAVPVSVTSVTVTGAATGGPGDSTGGPSATNGLASTGGVNLPTDAHTHSLNGVSFAVSASGTGSGTATGSTANTTWLPPMRAIVWIRKS